MSKNDVYANNMGALYDEVSELALHNCYDKFLTTGTAHGCMYRLNIQPQDRLSGKTKTKKSKKCACIYQLYRTPFFFFVENTSRTIPFSAQP
jgi:hypothetical protein